MRTFEGKNSVHHRLQLGSYKQKRSQQALDDWNRSFGGNHVNIDNEPLASIAKPYLKDNEETFASEEKLQQFFADVLLQNLSNDKKDDDAKFLMQTLHQGALQYPFLTPYGFYLMEQTDDALMVLNSDAERNVTYELTENGFKIHEQCRISKIFSSFSYDEKDKMPLGLSDLVSYQDGMAVILPDNGNNNVIEAQVTLEVSFAESAQTPKVTTEKFSIVYNNDAFADFLTSKQIDVAHDIGQGLISEESEVSRITNEVNSKPNLDKTNNAIKSYVDKYVTGNEKLQLKNVDEQDAIHGAGDDSSTDFNFRCIKVGSLLDENGMVNPDLYRLCEDFNLNAEELVKLLHAIFNQSWKLVANDEGIINPSLLEHLAPALYGEPGSNAYNKTLAQLLQGANQLVLEELNEHAKDNLFPAGFTIITDNQIGAILNDNQAFNYFKQFATSLEPEDFLAKQSQELPEPQQKQEPISEKGDDDKKQNFFQTVIAFGIQNRHIITPVVIGVMIGLALATIAAATMGAGLVPGIAIVTAIGVKIGLGTAATAAIGVASAGCAGGVIGLSFAEAKQWFKSSSSFFASRKKSTTNDYHHYQDKAIYQHNSESTPSINL